MGVEGGVGKGVKAGGWVPRSVDWNNDLLASGFFFAVGCRLIYDIPCFSYTFFNVSRPALINRTNICYNCSISCPPPSLPISSFPS